MQNGEARAILEDTNCILEGNYFFALKNKGDVATKYVDMDPAFTHPRSLARLGELMVDEFRNEFDVIAAPAVGGIPFVYVGAAAIFRDVQTVWADKIDERAFKFTRRGFVSALKGKRVLVLEDICSTDGSAGAVCILVQAEGGMVVGVSCIWNRGGITAETMGVPRIASLIDEKVPSWKAEEHPHWGTWPLVVDIGHPEYFPEYKFRKKLFL